MFFGLLPDEANHTEAFKELVYSMKDMETIIDVTIRPDASSYFFHRAARRLLQQTMDPMPQAPPTLAVSSKPSLSFLSPSRHPEVVAHHHQVLNHSSQTSKLHKSYSTIWNDDPRAHYTTTRESRIFVWKSFY
jgi:hypothetical protein